MPQHLTETQTLERAQLEIKREVAGLDDDGRWRLKQLSQTHPLPTSQLTLGGRIATGHQFKQLAARGLHGSVTSDEPVALGTVSGAEFKAVLTSGSSTSVGAFQNLDRGGFSPVRRPLDVLDLARVGSTDEGAIEYARQTSYTSVAAETAEATSTTTGTKAEATLPFEKVTETVQSISAWAPVTRRSLSDVTEMRDLVEEQLLFDARQRLEAQALAGSGTAPNLRGLDGTTGVQTQAKGADSVPLALAKAAAKVLVAGWRPTGIVIHPNDWVDGVSTMITAGGSLSQTLELPVIVTAAAPEGTGYCGDWQQLGIWIRDVEFFVSISHSGWFTQNIAAALAEVRAAVGVLAPAAFARITGL